MIKKKVKNEKKSLFLFLLIIVSLIIVSFFYFNTLIRKERLESKKYLEKLILESGNLPENLLENQERTPPEVLNKLRETAVSRYFLSDIELINNSYTPIIETCLYQEGIPIYPLYIYETWSSVNYPEEKTKVVLIRYLLLPEDNNNFQPNASCYIKEIKDEKDWEEIKKYNFYKNLFN